MDLTTPRTFALTGAGGFIGLRIIERLIAAGHTVQGLDLRPEGAAEAQARGARCLVGDITDPEARRKVCEGAEVVIHTAAIVSEDGEMAEFQRVNVNGSEGMAVAAAAAGASRFIHFSSVMVYGFTFPEGVSEEGPYRGEGNPYCQTKIDAEKAVMGHHTPGGLEVIILRPGDVYGPGSVPWVVRPVELMQQRLFILPDGGAGVINHLHIDNLIDGLLLTLERDATGEAFNLTDGARTTFAEFYRDLASRLGLKRPRVAPARMLRALFGVVAAGADVVRKTPPARPAAVDYLLRPGAYSIEKARARLGYAPRISLTEGLDEVVTWLQASGHIS